jgi:hypothetical protein
MMDSIWYVLNVTVDNKEGDFITCTQNLSVMAVLVIQSLYGLRAIKHLWDIKSTSAFLVVARALKI